VAGNFFQDWQTGPILPAYMESALGGAVDGMLAEKVVLKATGVVKIPSHLSYEEAAALPCAGVTAWNALMESSGPLKPGASVLTLGTGGVSLFAIQFAHAAGLQIISTSSSDDKLEHIKKLGVNYGINYKTIPEWQEEVKKFTKSVGVDQVIEVGGDTIVRSFESLKLGGTISVIGFRAGMHESFNPLSILSKSARLQGIFVGSVAMFNAMNRAIEMHQIKPIIAEVFDFAHALDALETFAKGQHFGKIIIGV
jgi:NADPH:quinone reductase-like Zn-dependent oxidoreductase